MTEDGQANTDRMLYVVQADDYWSNSVWVTKEGGICIKVRGHAITMTLEGWHQCALDHFAREPQYTSSPPEPQKRSPDDYSTPPQTRAARHDT